MLSGGNKLSRTFIQYHHHHYHHRRAVNITAHSQIMTASGSEHRKKNAQMGVVRGKQKRGVKEKGGGARESVEKPFLSSSSTSFFVFLSVLLAVFYKWQHKNVSWLSFCESYSQFSSQINASNLLASLTASFHHVYVYHYEYVYPPFELLSAVGD